MGAWGDTSFENDDALDAIFEFSTAETPLDALRAALEVALAADGYLEAPEGWVALAAAEVIAGVTGRRAGNLPEEVAEAFSAVVPEPGDINLARQAVDRVLDDASELAELWREVDGTKWRANVTALRDCLA